jgi:hypothetical protein
LFLSASVLLPGAHEWEDFVKRLALRLIVICLLICGAVMAQDGGDPSSDANCATNPCMTTYHNNNTRNGVNTHESVLVANGANGFPPPGWGTATPVNNIDSIIYAQPLYVFGVLWTGPTPNAGCPQLTGNPPRNMVYVATEANTLYAIDADYYGICTSLPLNNSDTAIPVSQVGNGACNNLSGSKTNGTVGITGTPVIDPNHNMLFAVSSHVSGSAYRQRLNAVDITNLTLVKALGLEGPINASMPPGYPTFYVQNEDQRAGLTLTKIGTTGANIYIGWGTYCDSHDSSLGGSFGLVSEFDFDYGTKTFGSTAENFYVQGMNTDLSAPLGNPAGVWMAGGAPAADAGGNVYVVTGNGNFEGMNTPLNLGNSIVKLGGSSFQNAEDFYTPNVWKQLNSGASGVSCGTDYLCSPCPTPCGFISLGQTDWDLGSGGVVLLTDSSATGYGEMVAGGKEGMFYVPYYCKSSAQCPTTNWNQLMGGLDGAGYGFNSGGSLYTSIPCTMGPALTKGGIAQCFYGEPLTTRMDSGQRGTPAYWAGSTPYLYTVGISDSLKAYPFTGGLFTVNTTPAESSSTYAFPGVTPVITSNGASFASAVVWVLDTSAYGTPGNNQAVLSAYAAKPPSGSSWTPLWTSGTTGPGAVKFTIPTIANGKVYVPGQVGVGGCGTSLGCKGLLMIYHGQ